MGEALLDMQDSMKDLIFGKKIRSFKVLSTMLLITGKEETDAAAAKVRALWKDDAVHMAEEGYVELVSAIFEQISTGTFNRPAGQRPLKPECVRKVKRSQWVSHDDTLAHRMDEGGHHKKFRGRRTFYNSTRVTKQACLKKEKTKPIPFMFRVKLIKICYLDTFFEVQTVREIEICVFSQRYISTTFTAENKC
jgi:hypothetical protein